MTHNHCFTCTLSDLSVSLYFQPYTVKFSHHWVFSFSRANFSKPKGKQLKQNYSKVHFQCDAAEIMFKEIIVSSTWEAKLNTLCFQ